MAFLFYTLPRRMFLARSFVTHSLLVDVTGVNGQKLELFQGSLRLLSLISNAKVVNLYCIKYRLETHAKKSIGMQHIFLSSVSVGEGYALDTEQ